MPAETLSLAVPVAQMALWAAFEVLLRDGKRAGNGCGGPRAWRHPRPTVDRRRHTLRSRTWLTVWFDAFRSTSFARALVGRMFARRLGSLTSRQ
jgi:hypothetical protein